MENTQIAKIIVERYDEYHDARPCFLCEEQNYPYCGYEKGNCIKGVAHFLEKVEKVGVWKQ